MDLFLILLLLGLSAAFSGSETAFFSLGPADLARMEKEGSRLGRRVLSLLRRTHDLLSALLIGNLLVNIAAGVVATSLCLKWFGPRGILVAVPATTLALLLLGEITPKMLALRFRQRVAMVAQGPLGIWLAVTGPALVVIGALVRLVLHLLPFERTGATRLTTAELRSACDLAVEDGTLTETEGRSLARLLQLEDLEVFHIMTPRTSVVALRRDMSLRQILGTARRAGLNRYPVLDTEGGHPVGLFHLKDLLASSPVPDRPLLENLREILFVPESKDVAALLTDMRDGHTHLAAVVDEHGDFTGIVTLADCLQALMGSVADTQDRAQEMIPLGGGRWVISGRTDLRELEENCGLSLPASRDYVTVAGFLMTRLGRVLQTGDRVTLPAARLSVLEMSGHRVDRIQVTLLDDERVAAKMRGGP
ncbi:MAG: hemolysin family protein [Candidatus Krumholzibacteriota bacterium]